MTVEIVAGPKVFTVELSCPGCTAILKATEPDMKAGTFGADYMGDGGAFEVYFDCPVCDSPVIVKDAPPTLLTRIQRRDRK